MRARERFASARVARLATVTRGGAPHLVPVCFALDGDTLYFAVDAKPKRGVRLKRLENIDAEPRVALLADHYEDGDWSSLWWARADGVAREVTDAAERDRALGLLRDRYAQYAAQPPAGSVVAVEVARWSSWHA